ncbi:MAG: PKD domain-containing protein [Myxococcota bacterium]|nr:PKD domain-containing protein [Myxococcota bacterium]
MIALLLACRGGTDSGSVRAVADAVADAGPDLAARISETVTLDGTQSVGTAFSWDFGDGESAEGATVEHAYTAPGSYAAVLTVTGTDGGWKSDTAVVTVTAQATEVAPVASATLARIDDTIWVVNPEADTVGRILDGALQQEIVVCDSPRTLARDGAILAVACEDSDQLALIDTTLGTITTRLDLPEASRPYGVVGRDGVWWVSLQATGQLARYDGSALSFVSVGPDPRGMAMDAEGRILATRWRSTDGEGRIYVVEPDGTVGSIVLPADTRGDSDTTTGGVPNLLESLLPSPDGATIYVPTMHANTLRGEWVSGVAPDHQTSLRGVLARIDAQAGTESPDDRKQFDERGRAIAVATSPDGAVLYVLHPGTGHVTVLDAASDQITGSILFTGIFPTGLLATRDHLYVHAWLSRTVVAYDITDLSTSPEPLWRAQTLTEEPLSDTVLLGKQVFHDAADTRMTKSGYIACAHCHPDGRDDGLTWDFTDRGEGLRNTTSLEGRAGVGMGPVHWTGNFDEIQDFEHDIRGPFAGSGFLTDDDWSETSEALGTTTAGRSMELDAMAAYAATFTTTPPSPWATTEGAGAFAQAGCADCHPPPLYTDSALDVRHDIGTLTESAGQRLGEPLDGFDTPTLLGAWATAPYLHDGSALTIAAAISAHDSASGLDEAALAEIAAFVLGL